VIESTDHRSDQERDDFGPPYTAEDLATMAGAAGLAALPADVERRIQDAAFDYYVTRVLGDGSRSEQRRIINRIVELSRKLEAALGGVDEKTLGILKARWLVDDLAHLQTRAKQMLLKLPKAGRAPDISRRRFIESLVEAYELATGRKAGRSYGQGPCFRFVVAAVTPLERKPQASPDWAPPGLADLVYEVIGQRARC
jgi:hypothetical protein